MRKTILGVLAGVILGISMVTAGTVTSRPVMADALNLCDDPAFTDEALKEAAGCREGGEQGETIFPAVVIMIQVVLGIIGVIGVGVIIYGGITYTISMGDAAKVARAKNIILYGVVGLVVAMLAYAIVTFITKSIFG